MISVQKWPEVDKSKIDTKAEVWEDYVSDLVRDIDEVKKLAKIDKPKKITIFVAPTWKHEVYDAVLMKVDLKEIIKKYKGLEKEVADYYKRLQKRNPTDEIFLTSEDELCLLEKSRTVLVKDCGCEVEIAKAEKSKNPKAMSAESGKPGILME